MSSEELIKEEAKDFISDMLDSYQDEHRGYRTLMDLINKDIERYYLNEHKIIYLNEIKRNLEEQMDKHKLVCSYGDDQSKCSIYKYYRYVLFFIHLEIEKLPQILSENIYIKDTKRNLAFISYSHADEAYLGQLRRHFAAVKNKVSFWDDSKIDVGMKWKQEIEKAIESSKIAILLLSADFFNSEFIQTKELPNLLALANKGGATIINVFLKPCLYEEYPEIIQYQAINKPTYPLSKMTESEREEIWVELVRKTKEILTNKNDL